MSYLLIMIIKYLQHCWTTFVTSCLTMRLSISHHKELRMYGAITNSAVYVTVTVTFLYWLAHMAVTRNFHVGLTYVHLGNCPQVHLFSFISFRNWSSLFGFSRFLSLQLESPSLVPLGWKLAAFYIHVHVQFMAILS